MSERRPIASRDTKLAARIARRLADRGVSPNTISQASMAFAALAGFGFWMSGSSNGILYVVCLVVAALGCQFRLLCNLFDGMVAVEGGRGAPDGPFWNEAPDRVADALILVGIGLGTGHAALGWAAAALAIGTAYIRELGSAQALGVDFRGPMAKPQRMALATAMALLAIFVPSVLGWSVLTIGLWIIVLGTTVTIVRRSLSLVAALKTRSREAEQ
ncbi:unnamed protein product [Ectocarpus sp. 12 AP-2014]